MLPKMKMLIASLALCCLSVLFFVNDEASRLLSVRLLDEKEWNQIQEQRQEGEVDYTLLFEGAALPEYHSDLGDGYLLSQDTEEWAGSLSAAGRCEIALLPSELWESPKKAAGAARGVPFAVYDEDTFQTGTLFVTTLPVMMLDTEYIENDDGTERMYGRMTLFDTAALPGSYVQETACEFHVRGSASQVYYKVGYKLNLLDEKGNKKNASLLSMREDDDWILRAMGLDGSKIREMLATELWNEMNDFGTYQADYVEVFLDGSYHGLYLLQEPMDFKTLDLDPENNFLVQIKTWAEDSDFWGDLEENGMTELECGEFVIDGNHAENLEEVYEVLLAYKKWMEQEESGEIKISPDRENLYLLDIFLMMITGVDNSEKNQFMVFSRKEDGSFQVRKLPWDMDATFGQNLDYITYEGFDSIDTGDSMVEVLKEIEPEMTGQGLKEIYWRLRTTVLQEEHIQEIIESLYARLEESGALLRENAAWDKEFGREQTEFVKDFVTRRFQWMDTYYFSM